MFKKHSIPFVLILTCSILGGSSGLPKSANAATPNICVRLIRGTQEAFVINRITQALRTLADGDASVKSKGAALSSLLSYRKYAFHMKKPFFDLKAIHDELADEREDRRLEGAITIAKKALAKDPHEAGLQIARDIVARAIGMGTTAAAIHLSQADVGLLKTYLLETIYPPTKSKVIELLQAYDRIYKSHFATDASRELIQKVRQKTPYPELATAIQNLVLNATDLGLLKEFFTVAENSSIGFYRSFDLVKIYDHAENAGLARLSPNFGMDLFLALASQAKDKWEKFKDPSDLQFAKIILEKGLALAEGKNASQYVAKFREALPKKKNDVSTRVDRAVRFLNRIMTEEDSAQIKSILSDYFQDPDTDSMTLGFQLSRFDIESEDIQALEEAGFLNKN